MTLNEPNTARTDSPSSAAQTTAVPTLTQPKLPLSSLEARYNPRRFFDQGKIEELAASIAEQGVIEPLVVKVADENGVYQIICGGRRYLASLLAGLTEVPVTVRDVDDATAKAMAITENVQREGLSPAEEARAARDLLDLHEGDAVSVAKELAWTQTKLKARLALLHCAESVLTALDEQKIGPVHAELLSTLPHAQQDRALPRIINDKINAQQLREELQGYAIPLTSAPFDTRASCNGCPHNSESQLSLFGHPLDTARCSNKACFTDLSRKALHVKRLALQDEVATVALVTEKDAIMAITLQTSGPNGVGEVQFATGCKGCRHFGALIEDRLVPTIGEVRRNICFDAQGCHKEKVAAYRSLIATPVVVVDERSGAAASATQTTTPKSAGVGKKGTSKASPKGNAKALPGSVVGYAETFYQGVAAKLVRTDTTAGLAFALLAAAKLPMPAGKTNPLDKVAPVKSTITGKERASLRVGLLAKLDQAALISLAQDIAGASAGATQAGFNADFDPVGIARSLVAAKEVDLSVHFFLDKAYLDANTLSGIESVLDESGFAKWFTANNPDGEKGLKKLVTGRKVDVVDRVLKAGFDWKGYVPEALRTFRTKR